MTLENLTVMSGQAGPLLLAALGATFVVMMGSIDLSVGSIALLCGAICAHFLADTGLGLPTGPATPPPVTEDAPKRTPKRKPEAADESEGEIRLF